MRSATCSTIAGLLLIAGILLVGCGSVSPAPIPPIANASPPPSAHALMHQVGAFNITSVAQARAAAAVGVTIDFAYGMPPIPESSLGRQLEDLGISVVSARISGFVHDYQCRRLRGDTAPGVERYCQGVGDSGMTESTLLAQVGAYARATASNPLVSAYWILDDQPGTDFGGVRQVEIEIAHILHHYEPSRPTICGVGAFITKGGGYSFEPALLRDVTARACEEIGFYVYSTPQTSPTLTANTTYDWGMAPLLSTLRVALEAAGLANVPWIGVGQAWGGINRTDGNVVVTPSTGQMTEQAAAFCHAGASAISWYGWSLTAFRQLHSPATDARLAEGVIQGGRACASAWAGYPTSPPAANDESRAG